MQYSVHIYYIISVYSMTSYFVSNCTFLQYVLWYITNSANQTSILTSLPLLVQLIILAIGSNARIQNLVE